MLARKLNIGPKLIIVCGLPGAGKTTHAKLLEELGAIRFCPDEWMEVLSLDLHDEERRAKIESLQWKLSQDLLAQGVTVIIEWGTWGRSEHDAKPGMYSPGMPQRSFGYGAAGVRLSSAGFWMLPTLMSARSPGRKQKVTPRATMPPSEYRGGICSAFWTPPEVDLRTWTASPGQKRLPSEGRSRSD